MARDLDIQIATRVFGYTVYTGAWAGRSGTYIKNGKFREDKEVPNYSKDVAEAMKVADHMCLLENYLLRKWGDKWQFGDSNEHGLFEEECEAETFTELVCRMSLLLLDREGTHGSVSKLH